MLREEAPSTSELSAYVRSWLHAAVDDGAEHRIGAVLLGRCRDATCGDWTKFGERSAIVGHDNLIGLKVTCHIRSWESSHGSRGCSQDNRKSSGGADFFYSFAAN